MNEITIVDIEDIWKDIECLLYGDTFKGLNKNKRLSIYYGLYLIRTLMES